VKKAGFFSKIPSNGWYSAPLNPAARSSINTTGITQLRLYFDIDDNNNHLADYLAFDSGDAVIPNRPGLEIKYIAISTPAKTPSPTQVCFDC